MAAENNDSYESKAQLAKMEEEFRMRKAKEEFKRNLIFGIILGSGFLYFMYYTFANVIKYEKQLDEKIRESNRVDFKRFKKPKKILTYE